MILRQLMEKLLDETHYAPLSRRVLRSLDDFKTCDRIVWIHRRCHAVAQGRSHLRIETLISARLASDRLLPSAISQNSPLLRRLFTPTSMVWAHPRAQRGFLQISMLFHERPT